MRITTECLEKAKTIRLLILDVDGVLTNGQVWLFDKGHEYKVFHSHDGYGMKKLQQHTDITLAIISGRDSTSVALRMAELGITHVHQGIHDKLPVFEQLIDTLGVTPAECAYVGDDEPDLPVMEKVGLKIAVANATPTIKDIADLQTQLPGGQGAVREVCDFLLQAKCH